MLERLQVAVLNAIANGSYTTYDNTLKCSVLVITKLSILDIIPIESLRKLTFNTNSLVRYQLN